MTYDRIINPQIMMDNVKASLLPLPSQGHLWGKCYENIIELND